jgi:hypothetical protein
MPLAMGRCSSVGHGSRRIKSFKHEQETARRPRRCRTWLPITHWLSLALLLLFLSWPANVLAMRPDRVVRLRQETVDMFYHGYDNYMRVAFPEDEVRCTCTTPSNKHKAPLRHDLSCDCMLTLSCCHLVTTGIMYPAQSRCAKP